MSAIDKDQAIRVYMIHSQVRDVNSFISNLKIDNPGLCERFVWDSENPEYIFVSEQIFLLKERYLDYVRLLEKCTESVWIGVYRECLLPDLNMFDYAICFDDRGLGDRVGRIPLLAFFSNSMLKASNDLTWDDAHLLYREKKFCNFMYSNDSAHPMRDKLYRVVSGYKPVDSTGRHLNNTPIREEDRDEDWRVESILVKSGYRFAISSENATSPGYATEKILSSFQAHAIPIYWGNPDIDEEYNPGAMINVHHYHNTDDLLNDIIEIDNDEDRWCDMVMQPWLTESQQRKLMKDMKEYQSFISGIFAHGAKEAIRRPMGFWPDIYKKWLIYRQEEKTELQKKAEQLGKETREYIRKTVRKKYEKDDYGRFCGRGVVYTAITGGYDELDTPAVINDEWDYYCFTDTPELVSDFWQVLPIDNPKQLDPIRLQRYYKFFPHKVLPDYDYSVYIDGKNQITGDLTEALRSYAGEHTMLCFPHPFSRNIEEEAERAAQWKKADPELMRRQIAHYRENGYNTLSPLIEGCVLIRSHHDPVLQKVMQDWWDELGKWSARDQLSFGYVCWKNQYDYDLFELNIYDNPYIREHRHRKTDTPNGRE